MDTFEYEITKHSFEAFMHVIYFCTEEGKCIGEVPDDQLAALTHLLNKRGSQGWDVVQIAFGKDGVLIFWRRKKSYS